MVNRPFAQMVYRNGPFSLPSPSSFLYPTRPRLYPRRPHHRVRIHPVRQDNSGLYPLVLEPASKSFLQTNCLHWETRSMIPMPKSLREEGLFGG